ncbi:hypothetical protein SRHO_G00054960 [Serrasalmus rhombeus]
MFGQGTKLIVKGRPLSSPEISLLIPAVEEQSTPDQLTVLCQVKNFYPDYVTVSWSVDRQDAPGDKKDTKAVRSSDGTYSMSSILSVSRSTWDAAQAFTCQVQHESLKTPASHSVSKSECLE